MRMPGRIEPMIVNIAPGEAFLVMSNSDSVPSSRKQTIKVKTVSAIIKGAITACHRSLSNFHIIEED